ncbi:MAG: sensor histidine kinase [Microcoleaceae cyanobacterium]
MGGTEFVYLAVGLGLGFASQFFIKKSRSKSVKIEPLPDIPVEHSDQTEQLRQLSKQLQQTQLAYRMASELCQFKAGFLARTSHELRSPINSMIGTIQLILADLCESPEEEREFLQQAYDSALKMIGVLDEIIQVAKTEHGTETLKLKPIQLSKVFEELKQLTHLQAANRSIRLHIETPDPNLYVIADTARLRQVLVSLVDNAIAQMERGKVQVSIHPEPESKSVHIWIDDQRPVSAWSESWDLIQSTLSKNHDSKTIQKTDIIHQEEIELSPGMRLLMNQTLLSSMNGKLEILAVPTEAEHSQFTRTQCSIPLASSITK